jgi:hypothetical protein
LTREYYLIVGAGIAALMNHLMLRADPGCKRIGNLPVLHVGTTDPWTLYEEAFLGQWPALLSLPGFSQQPTGPPHEFLSISKLAGMVEREWLELAKRKTFYGIEGRVTEIRKVDSHYQVTLSDNTRLRVPYVDICGGPGPSRRLFPSQIEDGDLALEYESGNPTLAGKWPRLMTAEKFLRRDTEVPNNGSVLVAGGGPSGAWCVERAEKSGCSVVWLSRDSVRGALLPTRRNDGLAEYPITRSWKQGAYTIDHEVFPARETTTFAEGYEVRRISPVGERVKVDYQRYQANTSPRCAGGGRLLPRIDEVQNTFDQVVTAFGQCNGQDDPGSWASIIKPVFLPDTATRSHLHRDAQKRAVAVQSPDGSLRLLGSSALWYPEMLAELRDSTTSTYFYFQTLPEQARVEVGFALAAVTIGEANGWFRPARPHRNLNTLSEEDLKKLIAPPLYPEMPASWIAARRARVHPWTRAELERLLASTRDTH